MLKVEEEENGEEKDFLIFLLSNISNFSRRARYYFQLKFIKRFSRFSSTNFYANKRRKEVGRH